MEQLTFLTKLDQFEEDINNQFEIVKEISRGSFATVFLAYPIHSIHQPLVLKIATELQNEWQILRRLSHPQIIKVISFHQSGSLQAICMPFVGELTMAGLINHSRANRNSPERSIADDPISFLRDNGFEFEWNRPSRNYSDLMKIQQIIAVFRALGHMHQLHLIHRDIKPANILISFDGRPMLIDFNMAMDTFLYC